MLKKIIIIIYVPLILIISVLFSSKELVIFPSAEVKRFRIFTYTDSIYTSSASFGSVSGVSDKSIVFEYTAGSSNAPLAVRPVNGIEINFETDTVDIRKYNQIDIGITCSKSFVTNIDIVTAGLSGNDTSVLKRHYYSGIIKVKPGKKTYGIKLDNFDPPWWWKSRISFTTYLSLADKSLDFSRVIAIRIGKDPNSILFHSPVGFEINSIKFRKSCRIFVTAVFAVCFVWISLAIMILFFGRKIVPPSPQPLPPPPDPDEEALKRLEDYIAENYHDPDLTVEIVARKVGISASRIPALLQKKYKMNFKKYLNHIRVTEAKRLLTESDRSISEIAFAVGYQTIPHFNREFKKISGKSPSEFRK